MQRSVKKAIAKCYVRTIRLLNHEMFRYFFLFRFFFFKLVMTSLTIELSTFVLFRIKQKIKNLPFNKLFKCNFLSM